MKMGNLFLDILENIDKVISRYTSPLAWLLAAPPCLKSLLKGPNGVWLLLRREISFLEQFNGFHE